MVWGLLFNFLNLGLLIIFLNQTISFVYCLRHDFGNVLYVLLSLLFMKFFRNLHSFFGWAVQMGSHFSSCHIQIYPAHHRYVKLHEIFSKRKVNTHLSFFISTVTWSITILFWGMISVLKESDDDNCFSCWTWEDKKNKEVKNRLVR